MKNDERNILEISGLVKRFGVLVATDNLSLSVREFELHALIGPNGAGKTTFISQLLGHLVPDAGTVLYAGTDVTRFSAPKRSLLGIARSFQLTALCPMMTVLENVMLSVQAHQGHSFKFWTKAESDKTLIVPARKAIREVGLSGHEDEVAGGLSHGQQRRLDIAMATATAPRLLLLDEPLAGLGAGEASEMIEYIRKLKGKFTVLMVEHDMDAVFSLADRISVLDLGRCIATGNVEHIKSNEAVRRAYLGDDHAVTA